MSEVPHLLIVDDDKEPRQNTQEKLSSKGYQVKTADSASMFFDIIEEDEFDLILLDLRMPQKDGLEIIEELRIDRNLSSLELPVMMMVEDEESDILVKSLDLGANDYVSKPINADIVRARVETHLSLKQAHQKLQRMARMDDLTGIRNRQNFMRLLRTELSRAKRYDNDLGFIILDIDHFKDINDTYGHPVGDEVLERIGKIIDEGSRQSDISGRYGGEEFSIFLPQTDLEGTKTVAERILNLLRKERFGGSETEEFQVTASLGISVCHGGEETLDDLITRADDALYYAKKHGRNQIITEEKIMDN